MPSETINFGLIGYGLFGAHHAAAIENTSGARLSAIAVKSEASRERAKAAHPGAEILADYRELVARADVNVVDVVAPNFLHYEMGRAALDAGKHLLLEKPMALSLTNCDDLVSLAHEKNLVLAINHELRLSSLWAKAKQLIDEGKIGQPLHALIELSRFPYREGAEGWRYEADRVGNWILEEPIHFFDLARWYLSAAGEPVSVYARANACRPERPELKDNFSAVVNFPNQAYAIVSQTLAAFGHYQTAKISGTGGTIWVQWGAADARSPKPKFSLCYGLGDEAHEVQFEQTAGELVELAANISAVTRSIRDGSPPPCTGVDGRYSTLLCLAAVQSVETGEIVSLDEMSQE